ncbi:hypothetical protein OHA04_45575 (plasmid) [Streptomyces sp. NBC_01590]|uniref:hypothetical protein n=1 Tax=Streptomyces sp. NBC_01590 TaxID=2975887 RepID=UPI002F90B58A
MAQIGLELYTDVPEEVAAIEAYWQLAEDGETWAQTVAEVRADSGLKPQELTRIVQTGGTAFLTDITCTECGDVTEVANRTQFATLLRQGHAVCSGCVAQLEAERKRAVQAEIHRRRAAITEAFPTQSGPALEAGDLSLFEAVALHALFSDPAVEDIGMTTPAGNWPKDRPWAPTSLMWDYERSLLMSDPSTIKPHPDSDPDCFVWQDGKPTRSVYLGRAGHYLVGAEEDLRQRAPRLITGLNNVFREGPWPSEWHGQWRDLWDELALSYASTYLDMKLGEHHLEMKQGDGTRAALADALATFSVGQVFNFIYRATKDSAAYYQRGGVNKRQAANSTVGRISAAADRARANEWEIKSFGKPWNLPLSAIGETFFGKVMWQADMMQVVARDVHPPQHAAAEQGADLKRSVGSDWPNEPSDDDINDCTQCGRQFYGEGLCGPCRNA